MNWSDIVVLAIIGAFAIIGLSNGFILSIFRLSSFFIAALVAAKCYPIVSGILIKTPLFTNIKNSIYKTLLLQQQAHGSNVDGHAKKVAADTIVNGLQLPGFLKKSIIGQIPSPTKFLNYKVVIEKVSEILAGVVIDIISLLLLFILIRIGMIFIKFILKGFTKLPVFRQLDKLGGLTLGAVEGLLAIYVMFAILMIFHSSLHFKGIFDAIDNSLIAKYFYQNNFIVSWMFPGGT